MQSGAGAAAPQRGAQAAAKAALDRAVAAAGLLLAAPVLALVALAIWLEGRGPVLFSQPRPGLRARVFRLYKFRTMSEQRGADGALLPDHQRLTPLGRCLRRTSLDELPQLWNVLRGELSLVGPRPLLVEYLELYTQDQLRRHLVKPGITGWAQVNGRNRLAWEEKFALDLWYVDHWSLWLDLRILFGTAAMVVRGSGVSAQGHATMPAFAGTEATPRARLQLVRDEREARQ